MSTTRAQFRQSRLGELNQLEGEIDKLQRRARIVGYDEESQHRERMEMLMQRRDEAAAMLERLADAGTDDWQELAAKVDQAISDLEASTRAVVASLRT